MIIHCIAIMLKFSGTERRIADTHQSRTVSGCQPSCCEAVCSAIVMSRELLRRCRSNSWLWPKQEQRSLMPIHTDLCAAKDLWHRYCSIHACFTNLACKESSECIVFEETHICNYVNFDVFSE